MRLDGIGIQHCSHIAQYTQYAADRINKHNDMIKIAIIDNLVVSENPSYFAVAFRLDRKGELY